MFIGKLPNIKKELYDQFVNAQIGLFWKWVVFVL